ncbi:hypothetical protein BRC91_04720 [Halobacteriales archaeon QS_4_62_28]|nr:MAG: hypothetical protein BRC91_04720 [Halobacteriales archaeon QS_4_62_28]
MAYRRLLLASIVVVGLFGSAVISPSSPDRDGTPSSNQLVVPDEKTTALWPYTSRSPFVNDRTLALNVIIYGQPDRIKRAFLQRSDANWTTVDGDAAVGESDWQSARGATRYTYIRTADGDGRWIRSAYQLGTGTYLGSRVHVRAYPAPSGNWTALQAHTEYWDWFRLRHTVTGARSGSRFVERDLREEPFVEGVSREYHGLNGGNSDGWLTVIEFWSAPAALVAGIGLPLASRRRQDLLDAVLPISLATLVVGVRGAGIAAEQAFPAFSPKLFAAVLYPLLLTGPLALSFTFARDRPATRSALLAVCGLGTGVVVDMGSVGVNTVPISLALHRVALVSTLALFTLGVARGDRRTMGVGIAAWLAVLAAPLLGVV